MSDKQWSRREKGSRPKKEEYSRNGTRTDGLHTGVGRGAYDQRLWIWLARWHQPNREQIQRRVSCRALTSRFTPLTKAQSTLLTIEALILQASIFCMTWQGTNEHEKTAPVRLLRKPGRTEYNSLPENINTQHILKFNWHNFMSFLVI